MSHASEVTESAVSRFSFRHDSFRIFVVALGYFLAHHIAFFFPDSERVIMLIWPAGGIGLAAFLLSPRRLWPILTLAFYVSGIAADVLVGNRSFLTGLGYMTGNMVESIGCAWLILSWSPNFQRFNRINEVLALVAGATFINALSSCIGAGTSVLTRGASFGDSWFSWYVSDGLGVLLVGPFIVAWISSLRDSFADAKAKEVIEAFACMIVWVLSSLQIFYPGFLAPSSAIDPYVLVTLLAWPAIRLGQRGVTLALILMFVIAIMSPSILTGPSPWAGPSRDLTNRLLELQLFLAFSAVVGYLMAAGYANLKRAEGTIRESEVKFRLLHESAGVGIGYYSPTGEVISYNSNAAKHMGGKPEDFAGKSVFDLFPEAEADKYLERIRAALDSEEKQEYEDRIDLPTGSRWFLSTFTRVMSASNQIVGVQIISSDISVLKQAEEALRASEAKYRLLFDNMDEGFSLHEMILDHNSKPINFRFLDANQAYARHTGLKPQDVIGKTILEVMPHVDPNQIAAYGKVALTREPLTFEYYSSAFSRHLRVRAFSPQPGRFATVFEDITQRKEAENSVKRVSELLKNVIESSTDVIAMMDADYRYVLFNSAFHDEFGKIYGLDLKKGDSLPEVLAHIPEDLSDAMKLWKRTLSGEDFTVTQQFGDEGLERNWYELHFSPVRGDDGNVAGAIHIARNVTDRMLTEAKITDLAQRYRTLLQTASDGIHILDENGDVVEVNDAFCQLLGYSREEMTAMNVADWDVQIPAETLVPRIRELIANPGVFETVHRRKDGQLLNIEINAVGARLQNQMFLYASARDITKRRKVEETVAVNERRLHLATKAGKIGVWDWDIAANQLFWDDSMYSLYGIRKEDFGGAYEAWARTIHPDDRAFVEGEIQAALRGERECAPEFRILHSDGTTRILKAESQTIRDPQGKALRMIGTNLDITEQKRNEEILRELDDYHRTLLEASLDPLVTIDPSGRIADVNLATERVTGFSRQELIGTDFSDYFTDPERARNGYQEVFKEGTVRDFQLEIRHRDGHITSVLYNAAVYRDRRGQIRGVFAAARDITERVLNEEALRHSQKLESIGTLAGGIAHDFNNLLNAMLGQSSLAINKLPKDSPAKSHVDKAIRAGERAAELTKQLLAYSGKGKFAVVEINLNELLQANADLFEVSVPKATQIKFELGSPASVIKGDASQIHQMIMNLIINAGEAIEPSAGLVTVSTDQIDIAAADTEFGKYSTTRLTPGTYALLRVKDTGRGMKPEILSRIFDPFFTTKFVGRGLGLAAVLGIVRGHGGGVRIESEEGKGTQFDIVFPLLRSVINPRVTVREEQATTQGEGSTVLVIDDEPPVLEFLTDILTEAKYTVVGTLDPIEGIELYRRKQHDISMVVLDYSMPGMDGKAALSELKKINKSVRILLCSGFTEDQIQFSFGDVRPAGFIHKPYKPAELLNRVAQVLAT